MVKRLVCRYWLKGGCAVEGCGAQEKGLPFSDIIGPKDKLDELLLEGCVPISCVLKGYRFHTNLDIVEMPTAKDRMVEVFNKVDMFREPCTSATKSILAILELCPIVKCDHVRCFHGQYAEAILYVAEKYIDEHQSPEVSNSE